MRNTNGCFVSLPRRHQKARRDHGVDQCPGVAARRETCERDGARQWTVGARIAYRDECAHNRRERGLRCRRQLSRHFLGARRDGAFKPAQLVVAFEGKLGQPALGDVFGVQGIPRFRR